LTVNVSFEASGNSSTRIPLPSAYSVMPSTLVTCRGAAGALGWAGAGAGGGGLRAGAAGAPGAAPAAPNDPTTRPMTRAIEEAFTTALYRGHHRRRRRGSGDR